MDLRQLEEFVAEQVVVVGGIGVDSGGGTLEGFVGLGVLAGRGAVGIGRAAGCFYGQVEGRVESRTCLPGPAWFQEDEGLRQIESDLGMLSGSVRV